MSSLKVYVDLMSQPCRALIMFLRAAKIPYEQKLVTIGKMEHKTPEFKQIHKFGKLPAISDNGANIMESVAILRYLAKKNEGKISDHWYPKDLLAQSRVDEFLEWQHIGLRVPLASYFAAEFLTPMFTGKPASASTLDRLRTSAVEALTNMEEVWLSNSPYVVGNQVTIADLIGLCEVEQLLLTSCDPFQSRPKLTQWAERLRQDNSLQYEDVHKIFYKVVAKTNAKGKL